MLKIVTFKTKDWKADWEISDLKSIFEIAIDNKLMVDYLNTSTDDDMIAAGPSEMFSNYKDAGEFIMLYGFTPDSLSKYGELDLYFDTDKNQFVMATSDGKIKISEKEIIEAHDNFNNESANTKFVTKFEDFIK